MILDDRVRLARGEARLNALPQFMTEIDGIEIHFIHVRSRHDNAMPLIMTHGWPGSVIELMETVDPMTDPTAYGGRCRGCIPRYCPSFPGYACSGEPTELGWNSGRIATAWNMLMERLGYTRYVAQGGDEGADVTDAMARQPPPGLISIHLNLLTGALDIVHQLRAEYRRQERAAAAQVHDLQDGWLRLFLGQSTRPQTSATRCWIRRSSWRRGSSP